MLTCLAEPQPPDAFRPSYCDTAQSKVHLARNLRRELLLKLPKPRSAPPQIDASRVASNGDKLPRGQSALFNAPNYVAAFQRPWLDIVEFGFAAPVENLPHYGQDLVTQVGDASLLLHMDYPAEEKERLLVPFIQVGIDFWGLARAGRSWPCHGGLNSGRKWPIVFAGLMLDDPEMQSPTEVLPKLHFHEDDQTAMCPYVMQAKFVREMWDAWRNALPPAPDGHEDPRAEETWK